jgi:hypothetical protein
MLAIVRWVLFLARLHMKTDGGGQYFSNVDKLCLQKSINPPVGVTHSWWSNLVYVKDTTFQRIQNVKLWNYNFRQIVYRGHGIFAAFSYLREQRSFLKDCRSCGKFVFVMEELETALFCQDRFSFIISPLNTFIFVSLNDLVFDVPQHSFYYDNEIHASPNYCYIL